MSLQPDHLATILRTLGKSCSILANGVVKLYLASPDPSAITLASPDSILSQYPEITQARWTDAEVVGGVVLVRDKSEGSVMFRIYSLQEQEMLLFEYELYEDIEYQRLADGVYCFEMDECVAGFAFADPEVAQKFYVKVLKNIPKSPPPKPTRATRVEPAKKASNLLENRPSNASNQSKRKKNKGPRGGSMMFGKKKRKGFFGKKNKDVLMKLEEIGEVETVEHKRHIGIDQSGNFNFKNLPKEWKMFFKEAGIKKSDLKDPVIAKEMIKTIQTAEMDEAYGHQQTYTKGQQQQPTYTLEQRAAFERYQMEMMQYNQDLEGRGTSFRNMNVNDDVRASSYSMSPERPPRRTVNGPDLQSQKAESVYSSPPEKPPRRTEVVPQTYTRKAQSVYSSPPEKPPRRTEVAPQPYSSTRAQSVYSSPPEKPPRRTEVAPQTYSNNRAQSVYSSPPQKPPRRTEVAVETLPVLKTSNKNFKTYEPKIEIPAAPTNLRIASKRELQKDNPDLTTLDALMTPSTPSVRGSRVEPEKAKPDLQDLDALMTPSKKNLRSTKVETKPVEPVPVEREIVSEETERKKSGFSFLTDEGEAEPLPVPTKTKEPELVEVPRKQPVSASSRSAPKPKKKKSSMKEVKRRKPLGATLMRFKNLETYEERAEPIVEIQEKIVEVVRYEESDELQRVKAEMERLKAEAEEAKRKAEQLEKEQQDLIEAKEARDLEYQRELEAKQEELMQLKKVNEELVLAKEKEEQEKEALREAKEKADEARRELERQNHLTVAEREEALRKMAETEEAVRLAQENLNATKNKLEEAQNLKLALEQQKLQEDKAYMEQLEAQQRKLLEVEQAAEELKKQKALGEKENQALAEAKRKADEQQQELLREKMKTEAEKLEALKRIQEKEAEMKRAEESLNETNRKLQEAEERAKKLPPPPPSLKKLPKLPPLQRAGGAAPAPPPLPPLPPPPSLQVKKPEPPPAPVKLPEKKVFPKGALGGNILAGITGGVKLVPVQKVKPKKQEERGLIAELQKKQRQKALIKNKQNRRSVMKALSMRLNRMSVNMLKDKKKANALMSNLQAQMMLRRANLKGKILSSGKGNDGNESDESDWSLD